MSKRPIKTCSRCGRRYVGNWQYCHPCMTDIIASQHLKQVLVQEKAHGGLGPIDRAGVTVNVKPIREYMRRHGLNISGFASEAELGADVTGRMLRHCRTSMHTLRIVAKTIGCEVEKLAAGKPDRKRKVYDVKVSAMTQYAHDHDMAVSKLERISGVPYNTINRVARRVRPRLNIISIEKIAAVMGVKTKDLIVEEV